jgi:CheY-like chemotaxis protein
MDDGRIRVLVVDTMADGADSLAALLGSMGYEARAVHSMQEGFDEAARWQPHAAIIESSNWKRAQPYARQLSDGCRSPLLVYGISVMPPERIEPSDSCIRAVFMKGHPVDDLVGRLRADLGDPRARR